MNKKTIEKLDTKGLPTDNNQYILAKKINEIIDSLQPTEVSPTITVLEGLKERVKKLAENAYVSGCKDWESSEHRSVEIQTYKTVGVLIDEIIKEQE